MLAFSTHVGCTLPFIHNKYQCPKPVVSSYHYLSLTLFPHFEEFGIGPVPGHLGTFTDG